MVYILDVLDSHVRFQESCVVVEAEHIEPLLTVKVLRYVASVLYISEAQVGNSSCVVDDLRTGGAYLA